MSSNDIREQDVPRQQFCAASDKTSNLSKNPKIQSLINEIINNGSTEDHTTPPEKKSLVDVLGEKALPLPPPIIEVFREKPLPKAPPVTIADALQENVLPLCGL